MRTWTVTRKSWFHFMYLVDPFLAQLVNWISVSSCVKWVAWQQIFLIQKVASKACIPPKCIIFSLNLTTHKNHKFVNKIQMTIIAIFAKNAMNLSNIYCALSFLLLPLRCTKILSYRIYCIRYLYLICILRK